MTDCESCGRAITDDGGGEWAGQCYECFAEGADRLWWRMVCLLYGQESDDEGR